MSFKIFYQNFFLPTWNQIKEECTNLGFNTTFLSYFSIFSIFCIFLIKSNKNYKGHRRKSKIWSNWKRLCLVVFICFKAKRQQHQMKLEILQKSQLTLHLAFNTSSSIKWYSISSEPIDIHRSNCWDIHPARTTSWLTHCNARTGSVSKQQEK